MVFQVYAGDLGQNPNSEQQMFNQLSRRRVAEGEGREGEEHSQRMTGEDRREMGNGQNVGKLTGG